MSRTFLSPQSAVRHENLFKMRNVQEMPPLNERGRWNEEHTSQKKLDLLQPLYGHKSRDSSVCIALGYGLDDRGSGVRSPAGLGIFLFTTASRPTQPPIQWVPGPLSLGLSGRCVKLTTHIHLLPRSKNEWRYSSNPPKRLHGVVLS
jgi:hypothetical protein